jgi:hypothetical protein
LVDDIPKCFCHINSSVSLSRADEVLCMTNVGRGKLERIATKRFRKVMLRFDCDR